MTNRPHQNTPSTGSGNPEESPHLRSRRDVAGELASYSSVSPSTTDTKDTSSAVDMHELITVPSMNTSSLVHGVVSTSDSEEQVTQSTSVADEVNNALVTSNTEPSINNTVLMNNNNDKIMLTNKSTSTVENPPEITDIKSVAEKVDNKDQLDYDPSDMQSDSYPSIYAYGVHKLEYLNFLTKLKQTNEIVHIFSNETLSYPGDFKDLELNHDNNKDVATTALPNFLTSSRMTLKTTNESYKESKTEIPFTTNKLLAPTEHAVLITQSVTNTNSKLEEELSTASSQIVDEASTINIASETKTPDITTPNAKHVLINLTISADDAENSSYKPLYSLTVTVPTVGNNKETPTIRITPMDVDSTAPTNFNQPSTLEGTKKNTAARNSHELWGGLCECSCPSCENSTDDYYMDYPDSTTKNTIETDESSTLNASTLTDVTGEEYETVESTTETLLDIYESTTENESTITSTSTDGIDTTTDFITETDFESTTTLSIPTKPCVCPKVKPPPILILEGDVDII